MLEEYDFLFRFKVKYGVSDWAYEQLKLYRRLYQARGYEFEELEEAMQSLMSLYSAENNNPSAYKVLRWSDKNFITMEEAIVRAAEEFKIFGKTDLGLAHGTMGEHVKEISPSRTSRRNTY